MTVLWRFGKLKFHIPNFSYLSGQGMRNLKLEFAKKSHNTVTITFLCGSNCYETDFMNCISLFTKTETILSFFRSTVCGNASPTEFFEY